ncbi:SDR family oxidoreductase [Streptomyces sp. NPDC006638]|uniref:SDR family NAD(P)-dependent oxidoreductase n=1 Tax=Streptomyces sp. NPDC006638 TaxID=3157183 RepID=UPI0033BBA0D5
MQGRNALVTGATGGIGRAVAMALAREGATVVVSGRDTERGEDIVRRIGDEGGKAVFVRADLGAGGQAVRDLARDATAAVGVIDVLVNNAAVLIPAQSMLDATEEQIDQALAVNIKAPFLLTASLVPSMVERGGGAVVNMGSINGETGMSVAALYGASKAGLHSLTKSWAAELAARNVRVNTVAPGPTVTEHNVAYKDMLENLTTAHPRRRPGTAEEVAAAVVFLAGDDATHIHGVTLPVDGGFLAV